MNEFFKNPSWISLLGVIGFFVYQIIKQYLSEKKQKNEKIQTNKKEKEYAIKQEANYKAIERLSEAIERLIDKEINSVNLMTAETIITAQLLKSKAIIKDEVRRIFIHNHRDNVNRQKHIKNAIRNITLTAYDNDIKALNPVLYKNKRLSEFLTNIDNAAFFKSLLQLIFATTGKPESELADIMWFIDSSFETYILNGKKYYSNL